MGNGVGRSKQGEKGGSVWSRECRQKKRAAGEGVGYQWLFIEGGKTAQEENRGERERGTRFKEENDQLGGLHTSRKYRPSLESF